MSHSENFTPKFKFSPSRSLTIIEAPFNGGQARPGVEKGPEALIKAGLLNQLEELGWNLKSHVEKIEDKSDKSKKDGSEVISLTFETPDKDPEVGRMKRPKYVSSANESIYREVKAAVSTGRIPVTLGGDHSIAIGSISGVLDAAPETCVVWVDAHADLNTPFSTESGNIHGCPVSFLLGLAKEEGSSETIPPFQWVKGNLKTSRLAYIGLRDLDPFEKSCLKENNIAAYTMHHVDKYGIGRVVEMALDRINPDRTRPIHLSFDIDGVDPVYTPATGTPVRGGLTIREGCYICEAVAETGNLISLDLVETNPDLGETPQQVNETLHTSLSLIRCALGETLL